MALRLPLPGALAALAVLPLCEASAPCRCQERPLAEYWAEADEVVVARFVTAEAGVEAAVPEARTLLRFELSADPYKSSRSGTPRAGDDVTYLTGSSTAECGIRGVEAGVYVLFAQRRDDEAGTTSYYVDSCSGSRILLAPGIDQPGGFVDVPPRFVMQQLNGLTGAEVIGRVVANAPTVDAVAPTADASKALLGLLDVSSFAHAGFARLHAEPDGRTDVVGEVASYDDLDTRESGYEEPAAIVLAREGGWYRLRMSDGRLGWLPPEMAGTYFPYPDVAVNRLNYIEAPWHGFVWPTAGAGLPSRAPAGGAREVPLEVHEVSEIAGFPWLRVTVLSQSPCEVPEPRAVVSGWIPAWTPDGGPQVWYYSRGC